MCTTESWPLAYLQWELRLLEMLGFGLDLNSCAVSGATENLLYVSPKSGRAVAAQHTGRWKSQLLPLVPCMIGIAKLAIMRLQRVCGLQGIFLKNV